MWSTPIDSSFFFIVSSAHVGFFHRSAGSRCRCSAIFCLSTSAVCGKLRLPVTTLLADTNFFFFFIQLRNFYSLKKLLEIVFFYFFYFLNFKVMFLCGFVWGDDAALYRKPQFFFWKVRPLWLRFFLKYTRRRHAWRRTVTWAMLLCATRRRWGHTLDRSAIHWMINTVRDIQPSLLTQSSCWWRSLE